MAEGNRKKAGEIVKVDNKLIRFQLTGFSKRENTIFFFILSCLLDKGTETIKIPFSEFRKIPGMEHKTNQEIRKILVGTDRDYFGTENNRDGLFNKMQRLNYQLLIEGDAIVGTLFQFFRIGRDNQSASIRLADGYQWLVNDLIAYTMFLLSEFAELPTKYAQSMFLLMKQWRSKGHVAFSMEELRYLMDIPESTPERNVLPKFVMPSLKAIEEDGRSFRNIRVEKSVVGRGGKVRAIDIYFEEIPSKAAASEKGKTLVKNEIHCHLESQVLTESDYTQLTARFPKKTVDEQIERILKKPYHGMLTADVIAQWTQEELEYQRSGKKNGRFHNFDERTYDFDLLEDKLFDKGC